MSGFGAMGAGLLGGLLAASLGTAPVPLAPGRQHNLTGWELQTCLESPRTVEGNALTTYADANFYSGLSGAIVMRTPDNDTVVTTHSSHPRTEFREIGVADWAFDAGVHALTMRTAVTRVSTTNNETIIAQIHGSIDEEIAKVLKLRWTNGRVKARVKTPARRTPRSGWTVALVTRWMST